MIIDHINLNHLRVFECVFRTGSMTTAAQELHLTQSGVSQHIRSLEEVLDIKLFDRIKRKLIPTNTADLLFQKCTESLYSLEHVLSSIKGGEVQLNGIINVGMPMEFGNNIILPILSKFGKLHPGIRFSFFYGLASEVSEALLEGKLDFAFVDGFGIDKRITIENVYDEELLLCASEDLLNRKSGSRETPKYIESLEFVDYQAGEPVVRMWFDHHWGKKKFNPNVRVTVMSVQGVAQMILNGFAAGVLPGHLAKNLKKEGHRIYYFRGSGKPLKNKISVAYLLGRTQSPATTATYQWLLEELKKDECLSKDGFHGDS